MSITNLNVFKNTGQIFLSNRMAYIASGVVGLLFVLYCLYNGYIYTFHRKHYKGIRFTTKNIAYITMLSAVSVSVTIVISIIFPITVFPPIRIAFEGLMIKICGYLFGPIVGFLSGVITDALCLLFVPSYIHIAYLIVVASFGFLAGLIGSLNRSVGKQKWIIMLFINGFLIAFGALSCLSIAYSDFSSHGVNLFFGLYASKTALIYIIVFGTGGTVVFLWLLYLFMLTTHRKSRWNELLPIIALCVVTEYWVTGLISSWGDIAFLTLSQNVSGVTTATVNGYGITLLARIAMAPPKIMFNIAVIYVTYRTVSPLIKKD